MEIAAGVKTLFAITAALTGAMIDTLRKHKHHKIMARRVVRTEVEALLALVLTVSA